MLSGQSLALCNHLVLFLAVLTHRLTDAWRAPKQVLAAADCDHAAALVTLQAEHAAALAAKDQLLFERQQMISDLTSQLVVSEAQQAAWDKQRTAVATLTAQHDETVAALRAQGDQLLSDTIQTVARMTAECEAALTAAAAQKECALYELAAVAAAAVANHTALTMEIERLAASLELEKNHAIQCMEELSQTCDAKLYTALAARDCLLIEREETISRLQSERAHLQAERDKLQEELATALFLHSAPTVAKETDSNETTSSANSSHVRDNAAAAADVVDEVVPPASLSFPVARGRSGAKYTQSVYHLFTINVAPITF